MKKFFSTLLSSIVGAIVALGLFAFIISLIIGSLTLGLESTAPIVPTSGILKIDLSEILSERTESQFGGMNITSLVSPSSQKFLSILEAVEAVNNAATDTRIKMIYMNTETNSASISKLEELRNALVKFKESGKPIIAYNQSVSQSGYYLSTIADKIYVHPMSSNYISGLSANIMFLKDALAKVGVKIQLIRHGKFKSAGEQFIASEISPANRLQQEELLYSIWSEIEGTITESRGIKAEDFNYMLNNLSLITSEDLLKAKLVDDILTLDQVEAKLCTLMEVDKYSDLKYITLGDYSEASYQVNIKTPEKIAILYANGNIIDGDSEENISSLAFVEHIRKIRDDENIKAVVLRVNSPGGSATAAEVIRKELLLLREKKPIVVSFGDYAASGGYWIAANTDYIFTNKTTLTGSIGVYSMLPNATELVKEKLDVNPVTINTHNYSDMYSLFRPITTKEEEAIQTSISVIYDQFISLTAEGRDMTKEEVDNLAQGRVWTGADALNNGLADAEGGIVDALAYTANLVGLSDYQLVSYPKVQTQLERIMSSLNETQATIKAINNPSLIIEEFAKSLEYKKVYALTPYVYDINF